MFQNQLTTFDPESKSAKIQNSPCQWGGGGGGEIRNQLTTFDPESKSAKIQNVTYNILTNESKSPSCTQHYMQFDTHDSSNGG